MSTLKAFGNFVYFLVAVCLILPAAPGASLVLLAIGLTIWLYRVRSRRHAS